MVTRFMISEADYHQVFWMNDERDRKTVQAFVPFDMNQRMPEYHSRWYDVAQDFTSVLKPVPERDTILTTFDDRLSLKKKII